MTQATSNGGLSRTQLRCVVCDASRAPDLGAACHICGGTLAAQVEAPVLPEGRAAFYDYAEALPVGDVRITLGEGGTPLIPLDRMFPDGGVYVKAEWMNASGSFKDRGAAVAVSAARALGAKGVVCASTGNNAASVSAYAARAGLPCIVALAKGTPPGKLVHSKANGAIVVEVDGTFSDAFRMAETIAAEHSDWVNLTSTYLSPYMTAAHATIMWELQAELGEVGSVMIPIGAGPMLDGIVAGAEVLLAQGRIARMPVPVGVQGAGCAPIARAFDEGADTVDEWSDAVTGMPGSINDPLRGYASDGTRTLKRIRGADGHAVAVTDDEIRSAMLDLGRLEGITAEPAAIAALAAYRKLEDKLPKPAVLILSGHILKDVPAQAAGELESIAVSPDLATDEIIARALDAFNG
ncbi:pyridoxal-phosphate dependent enzyme [Psychromarinibacter sp. S121]|uniref:pyridoxal-phosphate dependent enzyme n=1 Tax=Psychromarinibacter sp. S121 TaxID=3415127 RepID=UPI003C7ABB69